MVEIPIVVTRGCQGYLGNPLVDVAMTELFLILGSIPRETSLARIHIKMSVEKDIMSRALNFPSGSFNIIPWVQIASVISGYPSIRWITLEVINLKKYRTVVQVRRLIYKQTHELLSGSRILDIIVS